MNAAIVDPTFIASVRKKLDLGQTEAAEIFGGGINAFAEDSSCAGTHHRGRPDRSVGRRVEAVTGGTMVHEAFILRTKAGQWMFQVHRDGEEIGGGAGFADQ